MLAAMLAEYRADSARAAETLLRQGDIQAALGRPEMAAESFRQILALPGLADAERAEFTLRLGRAERGLGRLAQARQHFLECQRLAPALPRCRFELALTHSLEGQDATARGILEELLANPGLDAADKAQAAFLLADVYVRLHMADHARTLLAAIRASHPNPLAVDARLRELDKAEPAAPRKR